MLDVYQACVKGLFLSWSYWKVLELSKIGPQWGLWEWMMDSRFSISFSLGSWPPGEHLLSTTPTPCLFHDVLSYTRFKSNDVSSQHCPHCEPKETPSLDLWCVLQWQKVTDTFPWEDFQNHPILQLDDGDLLITWRAGDPAGRETRNFEIKWPGPKSPVEA